MHGAQWEIPQNASQIITRSFQILKFMILIHVASCWKYQMKPSPVLLNPTPPFPPKSLCHKATGHSQPLLPTQTSNHAPRFCSCPSFSVRQSPFLSVCCVTSVVFTIPIPSFVKLTGLPELPLSLKYLSSTTVSVLIMRSSLQLSPVGSVSVVLLPTFVPLPYG